MRVSNIVKNYIRSEIEKKYPMENLPEYEDAVTRISDFKEELESRIDAVTKDAVLAFLTSNPDIPEDSIETPQHRLSNRYSRRFTEPQQIVKYHYRSGWELENKNADHLNEIYKKREDAFNNIVVALELGGTKEDLERMLSDL